VVEVAIDKRGADSMNGPMTFAVPGPAYDRFMGRYSAQLAPLFADFAAIVAPQRVVDVGCGPGALTAELARRVGVANVSAADPSQSFVEACRARVPGADVQSASAEHLPWGAGAFDAALAQLVLSFLADADQAACEMRRVVRPGGIVAACMWLDGAAHEMTHVFWESAATIEPALSARKRAPYHTQAEIASLWQRAGLRDIEDSVLEVHVTYEHFDDFWEPFLTASGTIATYMAGADEDRRAAIREACRARLGNPTRPFDLAARACAARGRV
jgi:ubiquinone/menaquinone biosynthesis C-methylase UbiE